MWPSWDLASPRLLWQQLCCPPHLTPPTKEHSPVTLCSAKATLSPPKHTSQAMRKSPDSPSSHTRVWVDSQLLKMLSSRNASIAAACIHSWETNAQGNAFPCSHVTPRVSSTFWKNMFPTLLTKLYFAIYSSCPL